MPQSLDWGLMMVMTRVCPQDIDLWRRLASLSLDLNFHRQAIYCLTKVQPPLHCQAKNPQGVRVAASGDESCCSTPLHSRV